MTKILGTCFLIFACGGGGFLLAGGLSLRIGILEGIQSMLEEFSISIRFQRETVRTLLESACRSRYSEKLGFLPMTLERLEKDFSFPEAWRNGVEEWLPTCLKPEDQTLLFEIGNFLGGSDAEGQLSNLALKQETVSRLLMEAREEKKRKSRLFRSLGVLGGAFAAILIL